MPSGLSFDYLLHEKPEGEFYQEKTYGIPPGLFKTPSGKIELYSEAIEQVGFNPLPVYIEPERSPKNSNKEFLKKYPLILSTGHRNYYYVHSQFRGVDALKTEVPNPVAEMGVSTGTQYGLATGDDIVIETNRGTVRMKVALDERVAEGCIFVPHGWSGEANANLLTDTDCNAALSLDTIPTCTGHLAGPLNAFTGTCGAASLPCTAPSIPGTLLCQVDAGSTCTIVLCDGSGDGGCTP